MAKEVIFDDGFGWDGCLKGWPYKFCHVSWSKAQAEEVVWTVDFDEGTVVRSTKRRWEGSAENYEWSLGSPRYKPCATKDEAYEALAEHHKKRYEEALKMVGKINWIVVGESDPRIYTVFNAKEENGILVGADYDGYRFCPVCQNGLFSSRKEAEAESERRKKE